MSDHKHERPNRKQNEGFIEIPEKTWENAKRVLEKRARRAEEKQRLQERRSRQRQADKARKQRIVEEEE